MAATTAATAAPVGRAILAAIGAGLGAAMGIVVNAVVLPPFHPAMRAYDTMTGLVGHGTLARPRAWMATGR
jgi:hypothetical protein